MARLGDVQSTSLTLPSGGVVEVKNELLAGDLIEASSLTNNMEIGLVTILKLIVSWDFVDAEGNPEPINLDSVKKLTVPDFKALSEHIQKMADATGLTTEEKKI